MSFPRNVSPLAQRIRYDIENLFRHQYVHHPVYFRETDFKPGSFIYNNKERADEMLYFVKESGRLLDNILLKWKAEVSASLLITSFGRAWRLGTSSLSHSVQSDYIKYQERLGLHKLEVLLVVQHISVMSLFWHLYGPDDAAPTAVHVLPSSNGAFTQAQGCFIHNTLKCLLACRSLSGAGI